MGDVIFGVSGPELSPFVLRGTPQELISIVLSPDGGSIYAGGTDAHSFGEKKEFGIYRWDTATRKPLDPILPGHGAPISALAVSPDGGLLYSGDWAGVLATWDLVHGRLIRRVHAHDGGIGSLAVMPDGAVVSGGGSRGDYADLAPGILPSDSMIRLWDPKSGKVIESLLGHTGYVDDLVIDSAGKLLLSGSRDGTVRVWSPPQPDAVAILAAGIDEIRALALSGDGRRLYVGGNEPLLYEWDMTWMLLPAAKRMQILEEETGLLLESYDVRRRVSWDLVVPPQSKRR